MKRFFNEYSSMVIICIVISILLCIVGTIKKVNEDNGKVDGSGLVANFANIMTDNLDTFQKQAIPNENLLKKKYIGLYGSDYPENSSRIKSTVIVLNDGLFNAYSYDSSYGTFSEKISPIDSKILQNVKKDEIYTFSCEIKTKNLYRNGLYISFDFREFGFKNFSSVKCMISPNKNGEWQSLKSTFKVLYDKPDTSLIALESGGKGGFEDVEIEYRNFKLEKGSKATPYIE